MEGLEQGRSVLFMVSVGSPPEISGVHSQLSIPDRRHPPFFPAERANPGLRLKKKSYFLIYFLVVLGLCCCVWALSSCSEQGLLSSCGVWASHCNGLSVVEHKL